MIRAFAIATLAAMALAACANQSGMVPSSPSATMSRLAAKTCATSPPQYYWVFKGTCQIFDLNSVGAHFSLRGYQGLTVRGFIGKTNAKETVQFALADAIDKNGDIEAYKGKAFPPFHAKGITYVYAAIVNQSTQPIKTITTKGEPVLQAVITDEKGFGDANTCGLAVLTDRELRKPLWEVFPTSGPVKGNTVTIDQYGAPAGFALFPKIPAYFAANCWKQ